jgi:Mitovirus RNA-dependent RNA polymerase
LNLEWFKQKKELKLLPLKYGSIIRRLSLIIDPEGKTRIIAIIDLFSQIILKPISDQMFGLLRSLSQELLLQHPLSKQKVQTLIGVLI